MDSGLMAQAQRFFEKKQDLAFSFSGAVGDFVVVGFSAHEAVNAPFSITVELASYDANIDLHALMDTEACLGIFDNTGLSVLNVISQPRFLHGIVTDVEKGSTGTRRTFYSVTLRPSLYRLAHSSDNRIWQQKSVPDIVKEVLEAHNIINVDWRLAETHKAREYCTQYRETALAFVMRILAEEGIFYFFEHTEEGHMLIITDAPFSTPILEHAKIIACNTNTGGQKSNSSISAFSQRERLRSSAYEINDYTFKNPNARMKEGRGAQENNGLTGEYALYDYPGRYKDPDGVGKPFAKHRIESVRVDATTGHGQTDNIHLSAGYHFSISDHEDDKVNASHFILSVSHSGQQSAALEEDAGGAPTTYHASFATMPAHLPYRPPMAIKPIVDGPQIAIVTGPSGEEIYCDEYGRVKLHFPWDRHNKKDENSSCWVRVSQGWAGGNWGSMAIPRIDQEVLVSYLDGDPDQPIVTGRTYHAVNKPPYALPANKTRMTIKSKTHKGDGYNELRFEDEADKEEVWMHAQKDHNTVIENNETHQIGVDRSKSVGQNQSESVGKDKSISVGNDHSESIGNNASISTGVDKSESIGQNLTQSTGQDKTENVGRDTRYSVGQNQIDNYGKDHIENVGNIMRHAIATDHQHEVGGHYKGQVSGTYILDVGGQIKNNTAKHELSAFEKFVISGPGGKITLDAGGITLEAAKIDLKGAVTMGGSGSAQVPTLGLSAASAQPLAEECPKKEG